MLIKFLPLIFFASLASCAEQPDTHEYSCQPLSDSAYFKVSANEIIMNGSIDCTTEGKLLPVLADNPLVDTLVLNLVPGSGDDEANLKLAQQVNAHRLNTRIPDFVGPDDDVENATAGVVESGGVDLFLSGINRTVGKNACVGVHSWADNEDKEGSDYPQDHPAHQDYIQYFANVGYSQGRAFYFYTLDAQAADGMHYMSQKELRYWRVTTSENILGHCPLADIQP